MSGEEGCSNGVLACSRAFSASAACLCARVRGDLRICPLATDFCVGARLDPSECEDVISSPTCVRHAMGSLLIIPAPEIGTV